MKANTSSNNTSLVGMIKVGEKRLFVFDHMGKYHEMSPLCVLDFYVHESQQRRGFGRKLFDYMLASEQVRPEHLAIDSPSEKCTRFLKKHYGFKQPIPQNNNFVVFPGFFENRPITIMRRGHMSNGVSDRKTETYSAMPYYNRIEDLPPLNVQNQKLYLFYFLLFRIFNLGKLNKLLSIWKLKDIFIVQDLSTHEFIETI